MTFRLGGFPRAVVLAVMVCAVAGGQSALAKPSRCNQPAAKPVVKVGLPGRPFEALASPDGCWIFASLVPGPHRVLGLFAPSPFRRLRGRFARRGGAIPLGPLGLAGFSPHGEIAVLRRDRGKLSLKRIVQLTSVARAAAGIVLTHDGKLLIATTGRAVVFLDVRRMETREGDPVLGLVQDGYGPESVYDNVSADDRFLFVSDEAMRQVSVIDLDKARDDHFAQRARIGAIPVGLGPVGLAFSSDDRYLFITSELWGRPVRLRSRKLTVQPLAESADAVKPGNWPMDCHPEIRRAISNRRSMRLPEGALSVVSMAEAEKDPASAVIADVPAGCSPVRDEFSPDGKTLYVTARGSNALLAFDTAKLVADPRHALIASVPVGTAPVGLAVVDGGRKVIVANSSRFGGRGGGDLTVVDVSGIPSGKARIDGLIPAGAFPRELHTTTDGRTLLLTNFDSQQLELIDLDQLPLVLEPPPRL